MSKSRLYVVSRDALISIFIADTKIPKYLAHLNHELVE